MSSMLDSSSTVTATSPERRSSSMPTSARGRATSIRRRVPGRRRSSVALTSNGEAIALPVLVEEPLGGVLFLLGVAERHRRGADGEPLPPGTHGLLQLVEQDLEAAEPLVEEVLGLVAEATSVSLGGLHDLAGALLGRPYDLRALDHPLGAHPRRLEQLVGLPPGLGDELLALLQHPAGLPQLVRQSLQRLFEQLDDLVPVDPGRRRQWHRRCRRDDVDRPPEQRLGVAHVALPRLGVLVVDLLV